MEAMRGTFGLSLQQHLLAGAAIVAMASASPAEAQTRTFDVPAEPAAQGIPQFAKQAGVQIIASGNVVRDRRTNTVRGAYTIEEGLRLLFNGTGLAAGPAGQTGIITIGPSAEGNGSAAAEPATSLGEAVGGSAVPEPAPSGEIMVIGTRLKGVPKDGPQEVRTYSREQIEASGQPTIARFLNTLPEVSQMSSGTFLGNPGTTNSIQLRGLPVGTTLVLLDGHRAPNSGFSDNAFDINNIPEGLLERVDILPLGSSAIYGSDALAGVVNFVLNRHLQGFSVEGSDGEASHYSDRAATVAAGRRFARGDLGFGVSYEDHGALIFANRPFLASGDFSRFAALGGRDQRATFCQPGTVFALSGTLPGLGAPFAAIPTGLTGRPSISDFAGGANTQNLCNTLANNTLIPETRRLSGLGYGDLDITDHLHLYATILIGRLENIVPFNGQIISSVVGASNPFNPFGTPVRVNAALPIQMTNRDTTHFQHFELGLRGDLAAGWTFDLNAQATEDRDKLVEPGVIFFPGLNAALASSDPATAIDLFSPTSSAPITSSILRTLKSHFGDRTQTAEVVLRGPLVRLPGGPVQIAVGASYERQRFSSDAVNILDLTGKSVEVTSFGSRHVTSAFAELRAPLLASFQGRDKPALALSAAVRRDQFSDFGTATTPQFGLEFRPWESLLLRATSSQAFRAPTLFALNRSPQVIQSFVFDPEHGLAPVLVPGTFGGNRNLRPETGRSSSVGMLWTSKRPAVATVALTYWKISEHDRVTRPAVQALVDNPLEFPGRVVRDAAGNLIFLDATFINFGDIRAEGLDFDASDTVATPFGELTPSLSVTLTTKFRAALQPGSPLEDRLGKPVLGDVWAPRLKANASLGWRRGPLSASVTARYLGHYLDYQASVPNSNRLGGYALCDASATIALGELLGLKTPGLERSEFSITAVNMFNRGPQFSNSGLGFDPQEFDMLGRFVTARLRLRW
jgi:iron complex outermembrane recepter protein